MFMFKAFSSRNHKVLHSARWRDNKVEEVDNTVDISAEDSLEAAKRRADHVHRPRSQSTILIKEANGRPTREFELIWWPDLYAGKGFGKL
ncbi:hypothetical protein AC249_AIPGENE19363 [Exaiptasia diaphana]|nr:hypothetical protein AC249_AIPGENE19363 [Exaiptasia diaphana]